ncbi:ThiF family adenylyltransferase [Pseudomonas citronellolis]|uniref:ThiF family adenylyltransferase n=1 Tax=Pseudomonas citronellolis TaxID=53408 RepID=UPI0021BFFB20|nr:ThiF family adenylyltransferase [Pseudomonas citronellolis]UXJ50304.1 ThiF family adenylyltransferase [Pseudomonas citronellolis]
MMNCIRLVLTDAIHTSLRGHLFPGDGKEAAAILLCNRYEGEPMKLLAKDFILVPYDECKVRTEVAITWPGIYLEAAIDRAQANSMSIILVHSHPGGYLEFSDIDDKSDQSTMRSLYEGVEVIHGSAIMVKTGEMRARLYNAGDLVGPVELITFAGDNISYWWNDCIGPQKLPMAFTSGMTSMLNRLRAAVIGVSGTGSIVAEQLSRLGFGELILVDDDNIEEKNLNRILNSTLADAQSGRSKVEMFADAVQKIRGTTAAIPVHRQISTREAVLKVASADVIFCCVDTHNGRMYLDRLASYFLIPLFDVGVKIPTHEDPDDGRVISDVLGRVDYVKPGGTTLSDRGVYTPESLHQEYLYLSDPETYREHLELGYIPGIQEEAPSVITLNMRAASACVYEYIARAFPFRQEVNRNYARTMFSLAGCSEDHYSEDYFERSETFHLGDGCSSPLLGMPGL